MRNHPSALRLWVRDPRRRILPLPEALLLLAMLSIPRSKLLRPHHHWSMVTHIDLSKLHKPLVMSLYSHCCVPLLPLTHSCSRAVSLYGLSHTPHDVPSLSLPRRLCISFPLLLPHFLLSSSPWRSPARDSEVCNENERQMCFGASV